MFLLFKTSLFFCVLPCPTFFTVHIGLTIRNTKKRKIPEHIYALLSLCIWRNSFEKISLLTLSKKKTNLRAILAIFLQFEKNCNHFYEQYTEKQKITTYRY